MRSQTQFTRECRDPQWRQQRTKQREGELERRKNKRDRVRLFCIMGLQLPCFLCFDGLLVGRQVQFIEEEEDEALKKIEDIFAMVVERKKKPKNAKISRWLERIVLCLLYFVGQLSEQLTVHSSNAFPFKVVSMNSTRTTLTKRCAQAFIHAFQLELLRIYFMALQRGSHGE